MEKAAELYLTLAFRNGVRLDFNLLSLDLLDLQYVKPFKSYILVTDRSVNKPTIFIILHDIFVPFNVMKKCVCLCACWGSTGVGQVEFSILALKLISLWWYFG